jgi:hypothetical protein
LVRPCEGNYSAGLIIPDRISGGRGFDKLWFENPAPGTLLHRFIVVGL